MSIAFLIIAILALILLCGIAQSLVRITKVLDNQGCFQREIGRNIGYVEEHFRKGLRFYPIEVSHRP